MRCRRSTPRQGPYRRPSGSTCGTRLHPGGPDPRSAHGGWHRCRGHSLGRALVAGPTYRRLKGDRTCLVTLSAEALSAGPRRVRAPAAAANDARVSKPEGQPPRPPTEPSTPRTRTRSVEPNGPLPQGPALPDLPAVVAPARPDGPRDPAR